jgi:hypothetical protein
VKMQIFEFFDCKGFPSYPDRFGTGLVGKLVVEFGISCDGIFLLAGAI